MGTEHPRFGRMVGQHAGRFAAGGWLWYLGAILSAAGVMNFFQGARVAIGGDLSNGGTTIAMGVVAGLIGAAILAVAVMRWRQSVDVFERGLVHTKLLGNVEVAFADVGGIELVRRHSRMGTTETLYLKMRSGGEVSIGSVTDIEQLASMVRNAPR
jgi:hypothetical protein